MASIGILGKSGGELQEISRKYALALSPQEMDEVQKHFSVLGRNPSEAELETIAQAWSEHCVHKTFRGIVRTEAGEIDNILKTYIMSATRELNKPWCFSVFEDNAGLVDFDDDNVIAFKVETHNHPTALDPYGGAATGSGGVFRDIIGVGAKPILSTDVLFFGPTAYPYEKLPKGTMHPRRLMKGAVAGIRDYGNRMGIPTANGGIGFDIGYLSNPLVFAGCLGIMPKKSYVCSVKAGDKAVLVGNKTGRDGIHGVTFASVELTTESEKISSGAVQIGNPIEEKKVTDGLLRARDAGDKPLYSAVTDCGGGGLSSAVGEMGRELGVTVDLEKVPLKYTPLAPWEIWISETQERMILAVPPQNVEKIKEIFGNENCEATVIGEFTGNKRLVLRYKSEVIADLDINFVEKGVPRVTRVSRWKKEASPDPEMPAKPDYTEDLKRILAMPNVASKEWVIRQYDHEVQGHTIVKPLQGMNQGPGDACVLKPLDGSWRGIVVSNGVNPKYCSDPYSMALSAIDEAIRNNVCCGGRRIALLDNFSWGNPSKEDRMGQLLEAVKGCRDGALGFDAPFISGKDSLNNEYSVGGESRPIPGTLLVSAIGIIPDVRRAVTMDVKSEGDFVYVVGRTRNELGGSHWHALLGLAGGSVPSVDFAAAKRNFDNLTAAMDSGLVASCHDCSEGGMAVALAESAFAGGIGMRVELGKVPSDVSDSGRTLFSESNSRFVVTVSPGKAQDFEAVMGDGAARVGTVTGDRLEALSREGIKVLDAGIAELKSAWDSTFKW